jgi:hypothetical protein
MGLRFTTMTEGIDVVGALLCVLPDTVLYEGSRSYFLSSMLSLTRNSQISLLRGYGTPAIGICKTNCILEAHGPQHPNDSLSRLSPSSWISFKDKRASRCAPQTQE